MRLFLPAGLRESVAASELMVLGAPATGRGGAGEGAGGFTFGTSGAMHNGVLQYVLVLLVIVTPKEPNDRPGTSIPPDLSICEVNGGAPFREQLL